MTSEELAIKEGEAFLEWRRGLADLEETQGKVMTPYERNIDFWRQLWRCVERSDLVVQILDIRDPEFYRSKDLEAFIAQFEGKRHLLLLNKADFLTLDMRQKWAKFFADNGVDAVFFSALRELHKQSRVPATSSSSAPSDDGENSDISSEDFETREKEPGFEEESGTKKLPPHGLAKEGDVMDDVVDVGRLLEELQSRLPDDVGPSGSRKGIVGFVGYPNVGKSSVINCLFGAKKVSMSRTPGKTKHLQTLELPDSGITLCDCPGLVFPSVVATKAQLVINGTVPIDELREFISPVRLIVNKVGVEQILKKYKVSKAEFKDGAIRRGVGGEDDEDAHKVLCGISTHRQHFLRVGVPDETWSARLVIRDYCSGELLHCEVPPGETPAAAGAATQGAAGSSSTPAADADEDSDDFSDLEGFLEEQGGRGAQKMTKRKMRVINKQLTKGTAAAMKNLERQAKNEKSKADKVKGGYAYPGGGLSVRGKQSLG
eukprot:TRINITY_DN12607_c1_g3_i1.p1 TRINITY_DN12607_c1_g3~~TRINITY_DN12607_c1_g3_i1.p1  ORF type:complete len:539 (+),score=126.74 TRINITY_DN12607_c1_g3_i1:156-1619(+)